MMVDRSSIRNIGIISHIDAGKTTLSERILYYCGETHKMGEVHEGLAVMDWMPQEQERGITITATTASCRWDRFNINLIDTPGHIDFTIEVERALRVLDGAVTIFSAVEGVQPQSESVWRQADHYRVPRVCFINKIDRIGADYLQTINQMKERLKARPVLLQLPIGQENDFRGVIDLLTEQAVFFDEADLGKTVTYAKVPENLTSQALEGRQALVETLADFDDAVLADFLLGNKVSLELLQAALRRATASCQIFPVLLGSALRNKGVQPLLDAIGAYLPSPLDSRPVIGHNPSNGNRETITFAVDTPLRALAFKVMSEEGRMITYLRLYSGAIHSGQSVANPVRHCTERIGRLLRMHAHRREEIGEALAGDIVAVIGFRQTLTGDTLCDSAHPLVLEGMMTPDPVVSLAIEPKGADDRQRLWDVLEKLQWEDPTFRVRTDNETGQTLLSGMGELHLEIILDRLRREHDLQVITGKPRVVYRETIRKAGRCREPVREREDLPALGEIFLKISPLPLGSGIRIELPLTDPPLAEKMAQTIDNTLTECCLVGCRTGYQLTDLLIEVEIFDENDLASEVGLKLATRICFVTAARQASPYLLEPIMTLDLMVPEESLGRVLGSILQKRGRVEGVVNMVDSSSVRATVPLAAMFGYTTEFRSATKGRGSYTMEFCRFDEAPAEVQESFGLV